MNGGGGGGGVYSMVTVVDVGLLWLLFIFYAVACFLCCAEDARLLPFLSLAF